MKTMSETTHDQATRHLASSVHAPDYWRINLGEEWEIRFWTREFGVDEAALRAAVAEVGITAGAVRAHLLERQ